MKSILTWFTFYQICIFWNREITCAQLRLSFLISFYILLDIILCILTIIYSKVWLSSSGKFYNVLLVTWPCNCHILLYLGLIRKEKLYNRKRKEKKAESKPKTQVYLSRLFLILRAFQQVLMVCPHRRINGWEKCDDKIMLMDWGCFPCEWL